MLWCVSLWNSCSEILCCLHIVKISSTFSHDIEHVLDNTELRFLYSNTQTSENTPLQLSPTFPPFLSATSYLKHNKAIGKEIHLFFSLDNVVRHYQSVSGENKHFCRHTLTVRNCPERIHCRLFSGYWLQGFWSIQDQFHKFSPLVTYTQKHRVQIEKYQWYL